MQPNEGAIPHAIPRADFSLRRVGAMVLRYWYLLRGSWPRILELAYWPTMQMILWGYINQFMASTNGGGSGWVAQGAGVLVSAVLLWDVLFRGQLGVSISFLEEMWSRNLGHLFVSPLRPGEWVTALMTMSLLRTLIGVLPATALAIPFFGYSVYALGLPLAAFFANLIVLGWSLGLLIVALILRYGMGAEGLAWIVVFMLAPVSAVYYPVSVLPAWLQPVSLALPSAHVFEGMRSILLHNTFDVSELWWALGLNAVYILAGYLVFSWFLASARVNGTLVQLGE